MFGLETLDVLIGLATVYLTFGLACTAVVEAIAAWLSVRSSNLEAALNELFKGDLDDRQKFVKAFFDHPLVQSLSKGRTGRPSYIPAEIVGQVVEALVKAGDAAGSMAAAVDKLPGTAGTNHIKGLLGAFLAQVGEDAAAFRKAVETHFNAVMDRASGWFKRRQQTVALIASALLVVGANVDTISLANTLASSPEARAKMVDIASEKLSRAKSVEAQAAEGKAEGGVSVAQARQLTQAALRDFEQARSDLASAGFKFGWKDQWNAGKTFSDYLLKLVGLLVSTLAVSLGAPFWFDLLQGFMQIRASGSRTGADEKK
jgi:hypothetical protein